MAVIRKVTRVSNPRRKYRRTKGVRNAKGRSMKVRNRRHTRKRTTRKSKNPTRKPVIRRYTVTALKKELKRRGAKSNPRRRRGIRRKQNPVLIELGALNPKRRKNVAKTRKRRVRKTRNPRRHATAKVTHRRRRRSYRRRRRVANPVVRHHRRRHVRRHRRAVNRRHYRRHRNPALFGRSGGKDLLMMVGGGLVGVAATKYLPTLLPSSITSGLGGGPLMSILLTGAGAFAAGWLARRFVGGSFGDAVLFGGLMQTGSMALTAFAPSALSSRLALSGLGEIVPGSFVVPQNPIKDYRPPAPPASNSGMGNLRRFGTFR